LYGFTAPAPDKVACEDGKKWKKGKKGRWVVRTGDEDGSGVGIDHVQPVAQVKRVKNGWVVHVTERGEIVHAILNLSLRVRVRAVVRVRAEECEKCTCCWCQQAPNLGIPDEKAGFGHFDHLHVGRLEGHNMGNGLACACGTGRRKIRNK
jgi:hypothetical protein